MSTKARATSAEPPTRHGRVYEAIARPGRALALRLRRRQEQTAEVAATAQPQMEREVVVDGQMPQEHQQAALRRVHKLANDAPRSLDRAAKSIATACTFFITVYTLILGQATQGQAAGVAYAHLPVSLLFLTPVFFLSLSMLAAVLVLFPRRGKIDWYDATAAQQFWESVMDTKHLCARIAMCSLILGLLALMAMLVIYMGLGRI